MTELTLFFATSQMQWIVTLLAIDVFLGIIAALVKKEFAWAKLSDFMKGPVLYYVLGFAVLEMVGVSLPSLAFFVSIAFILILIVLLASIAGNLGKLGLPVPKDLKKR